MQIKLLSENIWVGSWVEIQLYGFSSSIQTIELDPISVGVKDWKLLDNWVVSLQIDYAPLCIIKFRGISVNLKIVDESNILYLGQEVPLYTEVQPIPLPWDNLVEEMKKEIPEGEYLPSSSFLLPSALFRYPLQLKVPSLDTTVTINDVPVTPSSYQFLYYVTPQRGEVSVKVNDKKLTLSFSILGSIYHAIAQFLWENNLNLPSPDMLWGTMLGFEDLDIPLHQLNWVLRHLYIHGISEENWELFSLVERIEKFFSFPPTHSYPQTRNTIQEIKNTKSAINSKRTSHLTIYHGIWTDLMDAGWAWTDWFNAGAIGGGGGSSSSPFSGWSPTILDQGGNFDFFVQGRIPYLFTKTNSPWELEGHQLELITPEGTWFLNFDRDMGPEELALVINQWEVPLWANWTEWGVWFWGTQGWFVLQGDACPILFDTVSIAAIGDSFPTGTGSALFIQTF